MNIAKKRWVHHDTIVELKPLHFDLKLGSVPLEQRAAPRDTCGIGAGRGVGGGRGHPLAGMPSTFNPKKSPQ